VPDLFNQEAAASDSAGMNKYGRDLVDLILPNQWTYGRSPSGRMETFEVEFLGEKYAAKLAARLAQAEQMARTNNGKLIPEAAVVKSYNDLMRKIGAPLSYLASEESLHKFRAHASALPLFPALFTANNNGTNCYPGEAVFLLYLLISNNGQLSENLVDNFAQLQRSDGMASEPGGISRVMASNYTELVPMAPTGANSRIFSQLKNADANWLLLSYASQHHRHATIKVFNDVTKTLGF
jgi:hypothetical protein